MDRPANVRVATLEDQEGIYWHLWHDLEADNGLGITPNPKSVFETVHACCTGDFSIAGIVDGPGGPIASIGIRGVTPWFSTDVLLSQIWLFVRPDARRGARLGDDLMHFAEWHRQEMSVRCGYSITLENTVLSLTRLPAKLRYWRRFGNQIGGVFWSRGATHELRKDIEIQSDDAAGGPSRPRRLQRPHLPSL